MKRQTATAILLLSLAPAGCSGITVRGVVLTPSGEPIDEAAVSLVGTRRDERTREGEPAVTVTARSGPHGCFGVFRYVGREAENFLLVVEAKGRKRLTVPVQPSEKNLLRVVLPPDAAGEEAAEASATPIGAAERHVVYHIPCEPDVQGNSIGLR